MNSNPNNVHPEWGITINPEQHCSSVANYPAWLSRHRREYWNKPGVVLWSNAQQQVTYLRGREALQVLAELRRRDDWQSGGVTLGEPAVRLRLPDGGKRRHRGKSEPPPEESPAQPEHVVVNTINLTGEQAQHLFAVLQAAEDDLRRLAAAEERAEREVLRKVVAILLEDDRRPSA
jgi:hypothetical protein